MLRHIKGAVMTTTYQGIDISTTQVYGHLEVGFTTFKERATRDSTCNPGLWNTAMPDTGEWRSLGTVLCDSEDAIMIVRDRSPKRDLLVAASKWQGLSFANCPPHGSGMSWRPYPPSDDYVPLGHYFTPNLPNPSGATDRPRNGVLVKKNHSGRIYARRAELGPPVEPNSFLKNYRYNVTPFYPPGDTEEHLILPAGTMTWENPSSQPGPETSWVLDLPAVVEKRKGPDVPTLENYNPPPEPEIITERMVTVPFYFIQDPARTVKWVVANSPFYKILRRTQFSLVRHVDYRGQGGGQISEELQIGVSKERSHEFRVSTGLTVGLEVGVEATVEPFGVGGSASMNTSVSHSIELGYSTRYNVTEMRQVAQRVTYDVPAGYAGALWVRSDELMPVRADGSMVTSANLKFNGTSYVGRTYPDSDVPPPRVAVL
jgi:hypothetical protein